MGNIFIAVTSACLGLLSIHEIARYARAKVDPESFPYPRRRLARRLGMTLLLLAIMGILWRWPARATPRVAVTLLAAMAVFFILALALLLRDLHETSCAVVAASSEMGRHAAQEMRKLLDKQAAGQSAPQASSACAKPSATSSASSAPKGSAPPKRPASSLSSPSSGPAGPTEGPGKPGGKKPRSKDSPVATSSARATAVFSGADARTPLATPFELMAAVALVASFCVAFWRSTLEGGLWGDEAYSIMLALRPVRAIIGITAVDNHPPFYYMLLKAWNALGAWLGLGPSLAWGRLPGLLGWAGLALAAWRAGQRRLGRDGGALLALAMSLGPQALWAARNMRNYSVATPLLGFCFLMMLDLTGQGRDGATVRWPGAAGAWVLYGLALAAALWTHLLACLVAFLLGFWWMSEVEARVRREGWKRVARSPLVVAGGLAHMGAALCFCPWLVELSSQVRSLSSDGGRRDWMTPPTWLNLLKVFAVWHPLGGNEQCPPVWQIEPAWKFVFGSIAFLVPAGAWAWSRARSRSCPGPQRGRDVGGEAAMRLARAGLGVGLANVLMLWTLDRLEIQHVFHGTRYVIFTQPIWAAGLMGLAAVSAGALAKKHPSSSSRRANALAWIWMAPWLVANLVGTWREIRLDQVSGATWALSQPEAPAPPKGSPLFVFPSGLIPYYRHSLAPWKARPIEDLASLPDGANGVAILILPQWPQVYSARDQAIAAILKERRLGTLRFSKQFPADCLHGDPYEWLCFDGFRGAQTRKAARLASSARFCFFPGERAFL
jgi:hypothetical protein